MNADDLLLISVGGAAAGIARDVAAHAATPMRVLILDTDDATAQAAPPQAGVSSYIFGTERLNGRGTGGDRNVGAGALRDEAAALQTQIGTPRLAVVLTCCGGGTSGAMPYLLEILRAKGTATLTFATEPFSFEGDDRRRNASSLLPMLEGCTDALARIPLTGLLGGGGDGLTAAEAFREVSERLAAGIGLLWTLITRPAFIGFDAERFHQFLVDHLQSGLPVFFADACCTGADRDREALRQVIGSPRFQVAGIDRLANAAKILVGVLAGPDLRLSELGTIRQGLREIAPSAEYFLGTSLEEQRTGSLALVVMAFGKPPTDVTPGPRTPEGGLRPIRGGGRRAKGAQGSAARLGSVPNRFADVEPTVINGQNLDEPTYHRRGIRLKR